MNALKVSDLALDNKRINLDNKTLDLSDLNLNDTHIEILTSAIEHNIDIKEFNIFNINKGKYYGSNV